MEERKKEAKKDVLMADSAFRFGSHRVGFGSCCAVLRCIVSGARCHFQ